MSTLAHVLGRVAKALGSIGAPFAVGGSVASSVRGLVRATNDVDIVVSMAPHQASELVAALGHDWYADVEQIQSAILAGRPFNLIYLPAVYKVDIFPATEPFHDSQLARARPVRLSGDVEVPVATAEDIILAKLKWYLDGGETSESQWRDVRGVIAANPPLDRQYLQTWAEKLGVAQLLARALGDSGGQP